MIPETTGAKLWTSFYILVVWTYLIYLAINHISNIRFGRFG
jgi:phosphatidylserine synthase